MRPLAERAGVPLPGARGDARDRSPRRAPRAHGMGRAPLRGGALGGAGGGARPRLPRDARDRPRHRARLPPGLRARGLGPPPRRRAPGGPSGRGAARGGARAPPRRTPRATTTASAAGSSSRSADTQGRVIAFGGRGLAGEEPKYLNSPETPLYLKGQTLYALHLARERMPRRSRALLVEGYVDCLMAHQHGFGETVAALGTAFTPPSSACCAATPTRPSSSSTPTRGPEGGAARRGAPRALGRSRSGGR